LNVYIQLLKGEGNRWDLTKQQKPTLV